MTYEEIIRDSLALAEHVPKEKYKNIWGVPAGGILPAYVMAGRLGLTITEKPEEGTLIVDDLIDSGRTLAPFEGKNDTAVLYSKPHSPKTTYCLRVVSGWIDLPHDKKTGIEDHLIRIFEYIGEDPNREGLKGTPDRITKMFKEIFKGYRPEGKPNITTFPNGKDGIRYDEMIFDTGPFYSFCEHHFLPFFGTYHFAYIPDKTILGLSKVARVVDFFSSKAQIQERLVKEIADELEGACFPLGLAITLKARHLCKEMRGVKCRGGEMITSEMRGVFRDKPEVRNEFLNLI